MTFPTEFASSEPLGSLDGLVMNHDGAGPCTLPDPNTASLTIVDQDIDRTAHLVFDFVYPAAAFSRLGAHSVRARS
jgi:hypothetical protein